MVDLSGCSQVVWLSPWEREIARSNRVTQTNGNIPSLSYKDKVATTKAFVNDSNKKNQVNFVPHQVHMITD